MSTAATTPNGTSVSFLDLPPELRLQVYSYTAIPLYDPFSAYQGLYLSCRQVKKEMDVECGRILGAYLTKLKNDLSPYIWIRFDIPTEFNMMRKLKLCFPRIHETMHDIVPWTLGHLRPFTELYLDVLILSFYDDYLRTRRVLEFFLEQLMCESRWKHSVNVYARRVEFQFTNFFSHDLNQWKRKMNLFNRKAHNWDLTWICVLPGCELEKASWLRKGR